ncbi:MAG: DUF4445 domain-containing protein, partial [Planctomycetales bacterium]|nr:DUF4445 domain-containing protein [Planctomycetales bacterium]
MNHHPSLRLEPVGRRVAAAVGSPLQDLLFEEGVEFPCGGQGACGNCRVRVIDGRLDATRDDFDLLGADAVEAGWRLACRGRLEHDATLLLEQWDAQILIDDTPIKTSPRDGWGIAVDLGTTTIAAQLVDLSTGRVARVHTGLNPQAAFGADIMSRVHYAVTNDGAARLTKLIRDYLGKVVKGLVDEAIESGRAERALREVVIVGNTAMHHLFAGFDVTPLARCPFAPQELHEARFAPAELDWRVPDSCEVRFLPCLGGFVGSDVLAGIIATGMHGAAGIRVLVDLGTNGEIVVSDGDRMLCAATAAGPAFEGARVRMGMRATRGAIDRVRISKNGAGASLACHVLGAVAPRGVCGSGLVDAAACALDAGLLAENGRLTGGTDRLPLAGEVYLHQCDIREIQLAKGAIAAGMEILLHRVHARLEDAAAVYLCGAFGNYLDVRQARRVGLLPFESAKIQAMGNTALHGAKIALLACEETDRKIAEIRRGMEHVGINEEQSF